MSLPELPWPVMAVDSPGEIAASRSFQELTGVEGPLPKALSERFEISRFGGCPLQEEELPWRRAGRGESFVDDEIWYDRRTSRRLFLHVQGHADDGHAVIAFENVADQPFATRLVDLIATVGTSILGTEEPPALAHALLEELAGVLGADAVFLLAAESGGQRLKLLASLGVPPQFSEEGLGLYVTKGLVDAHGGSISVESTRGEGSRVRIWLPESEQGSAERASPVH